MLCTECCIVSDIMLHADSIQNLKWLEVKFSANCYSRDFSVLLVEFWFPWRQYWAILIYWGLCIMTKTHICFCNALLTDGMLLHESLSFALLLVSKLSMFLRMTKYFKHFLCKVSNLWISFPEWIMLMLFMISIGCSGRWLSSQTMFQLTDTRNCRC